jgi:hypothetical protein
MIAAHTGNHQGDRLHGTSAALVRAAGLFMVLSEALFGRRVLVHVNPPLCIAPLVYLAGRRANGHRAPHHAKKGQVLCHRPVSVFAGASSGGAKYPSTVFIAAEVLLHYANKLRMVGTAADYCLHSPAQFSCCILTR